MIEISVDKETIIEINGINVSDAELKKSSKPNSFESRFNPATIITNRKTKINAPMIGKKQLHFLPKSTETIVMTDKIIIKKIVAESKYDIAYAPFKYLSGIILLSELLSYITSSAFLIDEENLTKDTGDILPSE